MSISLQALVDCLHARMPLGLAEPWDNVGLLCGSPQQPIDRVLLCIDWTHAVADEAEREGELRHTLIVAYHPPWFHSLKRLSPGTALARAVRGGAAIYSPHTAMDACAGGTNDVLAAAASIAQARPLRCAAPESQASRGPDPSMAHGSPRCSPAVGAVAASGEPQAAVGQGRHGLLQAPTPFTPWLTTLKQRMDAHGALVAGNHQRPVHHVAVAAGAGKGCLGPAIDAGADTLVTGELAHHDALAALAAGLRVVALLHSVSERAALAPLADHLRRNIAHVDIAISADDRDPFVFT